MSEELVTNGLPELVIPQLGVKPLSKHEARRARYEAEKKFGKAIEEVKKEVLPPDAGVEVEEEAVVAPVVDQTLVRILQWKRPHDSAGEKNFCIWLGEEIVARGAKPSIGPSGNLIVIIPHPPIKDGENKFKPGKTSSTLFSAHTDTVHNDCNGDQRVMYDPNFGHLFLDLNKEANPGSCLGADDGAGVWLLLEMIQSKIPGTYIFHRGEERGGIGSRQMLKDRKPFLEQHELAVAFDRKGQCDVITHQGGQRCASDKAGNYIAEKLNELLPDGKYALSDGGTFTDTKVYEGCIDECFNISCGYENAHGKEEQLDYTFLVLLRNALLQLQWDAVPIERDCKEKPVYKNNGGYGGHWNGGQKNDTVDHPYIQEKGGWIKNPKYHPLPDDDDVEAHVRDLFPKGATTKKKPIVAVKASLEPRILDELDTMDQDEIYSLTEDTEVAFRVIMALYIELKGAATKVETLQNLIAP